jgi:hypothetical protein
MQKVQVHCCGWALGATGAYQYHGFLHGSEVGRCRETKRQSFLTADAHRREALLGALSTSPQVSRDAMGWCERYPLVSLRPDPNSNINGNPHLELESSRVSPPHRP